MDRAALEDMHTPAAAMYLMLSMHKIFSYRSSCSIEKPISILVLVITTCHKYNCKSLHCGMIMPIVKAEPQPLKAAGDCHP